MSRISLTFVLSACVMLCVPVKAQECGKAGSVSSTELKRLRNLQDDDLRGVRAGENRAPRALSESELQRIEALASRVPGGKELLKDLRAGRSYRSWWSRWWGGILAASIATVILVTVILLILLIVL